MNTLENKAKFFAQYWGQEVAKIKKGIILTVKGIMINENTFLHIEYLELKPLSSISDEDAKYLAFNFSDSIKNYTFDISPDRYDHYKVYRKGLLQIEGTLKLSDFDYLRSKGYALPWNGITVEQQIEYGWIKLN